MGVKYGSFSSWTKLLQITAYVMRFSLRLRARHSTQAVKTAVKTANLTAEPFSLSVLLEEINSVRKFWCQYIQRQLFLKEHSLLQKASRVQTSSKLSALNPFLNVHGLIRVRGRLRHSAERTKYPIILVAHPLIASLIWDVHSQALYAGSQLMLSLLEIFAFSVVISISSRYRRRRFRHSF